MSSYTVTLRENAISNRNAMLGDIHNQLYLMFHSLLEEITMFTTTMIS